MIRDEAHAGAPDKITIEMITLALYRALRSSDPTALIEGDPLDDRVTIDGNFNLLVVSKLIVFDLLSLSSELLRSSETKT